MPKQLSDFLRRNSVAAAKGLPLVQTTSTLRLLEIQQAGAIVAHECDVFAGENINYFFVGRPAYKIVTEEDEAADWELPCCFIFEFDSLAPFKRIFPFDTGAHHERRYPNYITMIDKMEFEVSDAPDAPEKIIGAFFGSGENYFDFRAKDRGVFEDEYSLGVADTHVRAAHRLASHTSPRGFDDRRFTIEVQKEGDVDLGTVRPIAVVLPTIYLDESNVRQAIENWGTEPLDYPIMGLSVNGYYGIIYTLVRDFYKSRGYL